jgi:hypothetical protein
LNIKILLYFSNAHFFCQAFSGNFFPEAGIIGKERRSVGLYARKNYAHK